jgi:hypothetical protein
MRVSLKTWPLALALALSPPALAQNDSERQVFFGEQHVHTSWSFDAFAFGNTLTDPEEFYQYALGEPIRHPGGFEVTITKPLDWGAVTEHSDFMGVIQEAHDPDSALRKSSPWLARLVEAGAEKNPLLAFKLLSASIAKGHPIEQLGGPAVIAPVWRRIVDIADKYYQPGEFTTFAAFEWTSTPDARNLHRNIFFLDSKKVPEAPLTSLDSTDPRALWRWMDAQRAAGNELLAVSHNGNLSSGVMFPTEMDHEGKPIDASWAQARLRNEPLTEVKQVKGQSETTPGLSPNDEFADYEVFVWQLLGAKGTPREYGSYVRQAYKDGVALAQARGFDPYRFGLVGGSDSHVTAVPYRQENFFGVHGTVDDTPEKRIDGAAVLGLNAHWVTPAGLSAVWAEENTREAIFAGMKRKETYGTSGVRVSLRFFGGWDYPAGLLEKRDWVGSAYARGVPMGGELPTPGAEAPTFAVWASKDPDSAHLDRIQIVKGWSQNGQSFEKIYDVAWAGKRTPDPTTGKLPPVGSTVDLTTATYTNTIGSVQLKTVWTDPDFDPALDAFYYVRVLEIPTPRWSTIQAVRLGRIPPSGAGFSPIIQERAWSSPIWYTPSAEARKGVAQGLTVAGLEKQGAVALTDAQLHELIVGKTVHVRNTVTGQHFEILYGSKGRRLVTAVDGKPADPAQVAELMHRDSVEYEIRDGRLVTRIAGVPFEVTVYKLGDRYRAARSNEVGDANYEVEADGS